jgi:peptide deformylase
MSDELEILLYGNPELRQKSIPVEAFDEELNRLVDSMMTAMRRENGIGLAAAQVGVHRCVIIAHPGGRHGPQPLAFVNPELLATTAERCSFEEGCLSLPGITAKVDRPVGVRLRYQDLTGQERELEDDDLLARILQHEYDHLGGILFVDHLSLLRRKLIAKKLKALAKRGAAAAAFD